MKSLPRLVVEAAAAFAVAAFLARWIFQLPHQTLPIMPFGGLSAEDATALLATAGPALLVIALPLFLRRGAVGWALAALGPIAVVLRLPSIFTPRFESASLWTLAAVSGTTLGGLALAALATSPNGRIAIAAGFGAGTAAAPALHDIILPPIDLDPAAFISVTRTYLWAVAALLILAAFLTVRQSAAARPRAYGGFLCLAAGGVLLIAGEWLAGRFAVSTIQRLIDPLHSYAGVIVAVAIGLLFAAYSYRRHRSDGARWVVLMPALAPALGTIIATSDGLRSPNLLLAIGLAAAAAGTMLGVWADRLAPWDAVGVLAGAAGWLLSSPYLLHRGTETDKLGAYLLVGGTGFALAAGMVRLLRSTESSVLPLGFGLVLLASSAMAVPIAVADSGGPSWGEVTPVPIPALGVACALALTILFVLGRSRSRQDMPAEPVIKQA